MTSSFVVEILDGSGVSEARRRAAAISQQIGFDDTAAGQLAIAVTEVGTNIVKHAGRGRLAVRSLEEDGEDGASGVEALAMDQGPGIVNIAESLRDGHSTAGSAGTGLGALKRLTTGFDLYSQPGKGTIVRFEVWSRGVPPRSTGLSKLLHGAICAPVRGEPVSGDDWVLLSSRGRYVVFVVDGLGHGPDAVAAAQAAVAAVRAAENLDAVNLIGAVHDAMRATRGGAGAVAVIDSGKELCTFCGIGNIAASIYTAGKSRSMASHNGILGHQVRKFQDFSYPFPRGSLLIAHSDGLTTRWDLGAYAGLEPRHPALVAAALFRDFSRGRDDATVVAVRPEERAA